MARQGGDRISGGSPTLLLFVELLWHAKGPHSSGSPIAFAACQGRDHILKGRLRLIWWTYYPLLFGFGNMPKALLLSQLWPSIPLVCGVSARFQIFPTIALAGASAGGRS